MSSGDRTSQNVTLAVQAVVGLMLAGGALHLFNQGDSSAVVLLVGAMLFAAGTINTLTHKLDGGDA